MATPSLIEISTYIEINGTLTIFEEGPVPFPVRRVFLVQSSNGASRGAHAHRMCQQLLVAIGGEITVTTTDGITEWIHHLTSASPGLMIPAMIWATQKYAGTDARLLVICDQLFDEADYIRDFAEFTSLVGKATD